MERNNFSKLQPLMKILPLFILLFAVSCEKSPLLFNEGPDAMVGVQLENLKTIPWNPEVIQSKVKFEQDMLVTYRDNIEYKEVKVQDGGTVGGDATYGNKVEIPAYALSSDQIIGVQIACGDIDNVLNYDEGQALLNTLDEMNDDLTLLQSNVADGGLVDKIEKALEALDLNRVYFAVYPIYSDTKAFDKFKKEVAEKMKDVAKKAAEGNIDIQWLPVSRAVAENAVTVTRQLATDAIDLVLTFDSYNQGKIDDAWSKLAEGDVKNETYDALPNGYDWYKYNDAVAKYKDAWKNAKDAVDVASEPCGAQVDFLPSQNFEADVTVTLSWEALNFNGDASTLNVYWYNPSTDSWILVPDPVINTQDETISIDIDHFTRYAWAIG